jgi:hypothetical protein
MEHPFPWPQLKGIFCPGDNNEFYSTLNENPQCILTEKLDGSNFCVSSQGWIASRRVVIANRTDNLKDKKFNSHSLECIEDVIHKLDKLTVWFQENVGKDKCKVDVLLYGEFMLGGTSHCRTDIYNYERKDYEPGHFYVFGMGLIRASAENDDDPMSRFAKMFGKTIMLTSKDNVPYHILPINLQLTEILDTFHIEHVDITDQDTFVHLLSNANHAGHLMDQTLEGFVLSYGTDMWKWKYLPKKDTRHVEYLDQLKDTLIDNGDDTKSVLHTLTNILNSANSPGDPNAFDTLFNSAASKYPCIDDIFNNAKNHTNMQRKREVGTYRTQIWTDMLEDMQFQADGKRLDVNTKLEMKRKLDKKIQQLCSKYFSRHIIL